MSQAMPTKEEILGAIRDVAGRLGKPPSRHEFHQNCPISQHQVQKHFLSWNEAVSAAGLEPDTTRQRIPNDELLADWGSLVRELREIPTMVRYNHEGNFSPDVFRRRFGPWSALPDAFREFAADKPEWLDVVALLPVERPSAEQEPVASIDSSMNEPATVSSRHAPLAGRATYGNPIDFRGLRHEPVNEQGVVFLFGMVAKELGYMVEAVQAGFPDCEAKRQTGPNRWQRVRIEFEFESRNFHDHGHPHEGCDVIVCWRHNWSECPDNLEIVELSRVIETLSRGED